MASGWGFVSTPSSTIKFRVVLKSFPNPEYSEYLKLEASEDGSVVLKHKTNVVDIVHFLYMNYSLCSMVSPKWTQSWGAHDREHLRDYIQFFPAAY